MKLPEYLAKASQNAYNIQNVTLYPTRRSLPPGPEFGVPEYRVEYRLRVDIEDIGSIYCDADGSVIRFVSPVSPAEEYARLAPQ